MIYNVTLKVDLTKLKVRKGESLAYLPCPIEAMQNEKIRKTF